MYVSNKDVYYLLMDALLIALKCVVISELNELLNCLEISLEIMLYSHAFQL